jgi:D-glycero-D-manno-heptose 1,7-bisphosphate phosphatase
MKAIFLDRDGVINKDPGGWTRYNYVTELKDFHFIPGALKALRLLREHGFKVIIVSNQGGVAKGYFTKERLEAVNNFMLDEIRSAGARIEDVYYCIHKDEDNCGCRKPKTGMFEKAIEKYSIRPRDTFIIGDSYVDIEAGKQVGLNTVFVLSGKATLEDLRKRGLKPDYVFKDLLEAVGWMLEKEKRKSDRATRRKIETKREKTDEPRPDDEQGGHGEEVAG